MQTSFQGFQLPRSVEIVNVASVPQLSPFRYPGGKTWLVPFVSKWLRSLSVRPEILVDPFLGGGSVPLSALSEDLIGHLVVREIDKDVGAVWKCIFSGCHDQLSIKILSFQVSREGVIRELEKEGGTLADRAFRVILRNRTYRGGILAKGASLMNAGENGRGVASRWYPQTLVKRIQYLATLRDRIEFRCEDGLDTIREYAAEPGAVFFVDPPYTAGNGKRAGTRLYNHNELDHEELFWLMSNCKGNFLMTYDDDREVLALARKFRFRVERIPMKNTHHEEKFELAITKV